MGKNKRKVRVTSIFVCPECKLEFPLPRIHGEQRERGHIKDLYCPVCNKIQKFTEYAYKQPYKTLDGDIIGEKEEKMKNETKIVKELLKVLFPEERFLVRFQDASNYIDSSDKIRITCIGDTPLEDVIKSVRRCCRGILVYKAGVFMTVSHKNDKSYIVFPDGKRYDMDMVEFIEIAK